MAVRGHRSQHVAVSGFYAKQANIIYFISSSSSLFSFLKLKACPHRIKLQAQDSTVTAYGAF
jgi:hypothetical protein